jgi:hypothetical protein
MVEEINIESIECHNDYYQIDIKYLECGDREQIFVRKDDLLAMIAVAEKKQIDSHYYQREDARVWKKKQ